MNPKPLTPRAKRAARRGERPSPTDDRDSRTLGASPDDATASTGPAEQPKRHKREDQIITLLHCDDGLTAQMLAEAVGWQAHSVRGIISGKLKKRTDIVVTVLRGDGPVRYRVTDAPASAS